nr:5'/3'-nucleotidase SurE [uncultured Desulfosarcina sp.]
MKIVVTNDDGYDHPGLAALVETAARFGDVTVVAPATPQSYGGHRVTVREPILVERPSQNTYVVHGTPADCSRLAIKELVSDIDWVMAGINPGANLGSDVFQSGTVAAAREAAILGVRAVAVSQYIAAGCRVDWPAARAQLIRRLPALLTTPLAPGHFLNVNLPSPIRAEDSLHHQFCPLDKHPHKYRYVEDRGRYRYQGVIHDRPRAPGSDVDVCFGGAISVSLLEI